MSISGKTKERVLLFHYSAILDGGGGYTEYQIIVSWEGGAETNGTLFPSHHRFVSQRQLANST